jgi:hypothetical protein
MESTEGAAGVPAPRRPTGDPGRPPLLAPTVGPPLLKSGVVEHACEVRYAKHVHLYIE